MYRSIKSWPPWPLNAPLRRCATSTTCLKHFPQPHDAESELVSGSDGVCPRPFRDHSDPSGTPLGSASATPALTGLKIIPAFGPLAHRGRLIGGTRWALKADGGCMGRSSRDILSALSQGTLASRGTAADRAVTVKDSSQRPPSISGLPIG
jgi:hypothetical protein